MSESAHDKLPIFALLQLVYFFLFCYSNYIIYLLLLEYASVSLLVLSFITNISWTFLLIRDFIKHHYHIYSLYLPKWYMENIFLPWKIDKALAKMMMRTNKNTGRKRNPDEQPWRIQSSSGNSSCMVTESKFGGK